MPNTTKPAAVESETRTTTGNLALAPPIGQPILTGSRAIPNNAPLIKRLLNIRLDDHLCKLILVAAASYSNPWGGEDGGYAWRRTAPYGSWPRRPAATSTNAGRSSRRLGS